MLKAFFKHCTVVSKKLHEMVWNSILKHLETSSVHGVAHIVGQDSSWPRRILWFIVLVLSLVYAGIMLESSIIGNILMTISHIWIQNLFVCSKVHSLSRMKYAVHTCLTNWVRICRGPRGPNIPSPSKFVSRYAQFREGFAQDLSSSLSLTPCLQKGKPPIYLHWDFGNLEKNTVWTGKNNQFVFKLGKKFQFEICIKLAKSKIPVRVVRNVISKWTKMEFPRFPFFDSQQWV